MGALPLPSNVVLSAPGSGETGAEAVADTAAAAPATGVPTAAAPPAAVIPAKKLPEPPAALDAEKLIVYRVALELQVRCGVLAPAGHRVLQDQLERASLSAVLCVAEGAGRRSLKDKRRFYAMARGSAMETAAAIDVLRARHLAPEEACAAARALALRVVQLLSKLDAALA
jgi:four helix bundle protein